MHRPPTDWGGKMEQSKNVYFTYFRVVCTCSGWRRSFVYSDRNIRTSPHLRNADVYHAVWLQQEAVAARSAGRAAYLPQSPWLRSTVNQYRRWMGLALPWSSLRLPGRQGAEDERLSLLHGLCWEHAGERVVCSWFVIKLCRTARHHARPAIQ